MTRPRLVYHFTHIDNLVSIAEHGLTSDRATQTQRTDFVEVGNQEIKEQRRRRTVPVPPGGSVGDYVPFYFAPRSPMLYAIHRKNVPTYQDGQDSLIYLVTRVDRLVELDLTFVITDRNAALGFARFSNDLGELDRLIDWDLMAGSAWFNTDDEPDRLERRMAELLVHRQVPWSAFVGIATRTSERARQVESLLASVNTEINLVKPRPDWYF